MEAILLSIAAAFLIALGHVLARFGLGTVSPLRGAGVSVPTAALAFLLLSPAFVDWSLWNWSVLPVFAIVGCLFPAAATLMNFESNRQIGPGLTAALSNLTPIFAVLAGLVLLGEVPRLGQALALVVILAGIALLLWKPERLIGTLPAWALAIPLVGGAIRGFTQPIVKLGQLDWPDPYAATMIGYVASTIVILGVKALAERGVEPPPAERGTLWFMAAGLSNGLSVLALYAALARAPVALVAPLVASYPLFAVALSRAFIGTSIDARGVVGIAVTIGGIALLLAA